ncbi:MAG: hypothetical protein H7296_03465 [Bacteroidia bacterium]|nr:hypothetical protein [Bacteroidia bacterium]
MKQIILSILYLSLILPATAQTFSAEYSALVRKADSLYESKDFKGSGYAYTQAFNANKGKGASTDRYNAAFAWALAGMSDSTFFQLNRIVNVANYYNYAQITHDHDLNNLHTDNRWQPLLDLIKQNKERVEANLNKPLVALLDSIYNDDQSLRKELDIIEKKFGLGSIEVKECWSVISKNDSINLIKVEAFLHKYGWLGSDVIGVKGNSTLFLVIQHSNQTAQEKYLPMMREAVKNGKANGSSLGLLEDRVALNRSTKKVYGSQVAKDKETGLYYVRPLEDPDNVDNRRAAIGLQPLADYVRRWQINWNVELYKKDLVWIIEKERGK